MKTQINHATLGTITYEESFWTGKKSLSLNGKPLLKQGKRIFVNTADETSKFYTVSGNFIKGVTLLVDGMTIDIIPKSKWYESALSIMIFVLVLAWGNSPVLCSILPVVGGAIGGAIAGSLAMTNLVWIKRQKSIIAKILISFGMLIATFIICIIVAFILLILMA